MKKLCLAMFMILALADASLAQSSGASLDEPIGPRDVERLSVNAKAAGVDILGDIRLAYQDDDAALGRVLAYSQTFLKLDREARTYGQMLQSSFCDPSNRALLERFSRFVAAESPEIRQRVRDFVYFELIRGRVKTRKDAEERARKTAPLLFPDDYVFGQNDPMFKRR